MIPKIIHYCWFGKNPKPELAIKCIDSWRKYCPDYQIIEWNEDNFDINCNTYVKEAYEAKKWAFVTDYVRLYALLTYGGVYMDTDVEVIKSLDIFLENKAFSGFEAQERIPTGIMGCEKGFPLFLELLNSYDNRTFVKEDGSYDLTTNVSSITEICLKHSLKLNNEFQVIEGFSLYPNDYFCPKDYETGIVNLTENTVTIHHFSGSWISNYSKLYTQLINRLYQKYGKRMGNFLFNTIYLPYRLYLNIKETNLNNTIKKIINRVLKK